MSSGPDMQKLFVLLCAGVLATGVLCGIILAIVGAAGRKRGMLIGGLVTLGVSIALALMSSVGVFFYAATPGTAMRPAAAVPVSVTYADVATPEGILPADPLALGAEAAKVRLLSLSLSDAEAEVVSGICETEAGTGDILEARFESIPWRDMSEAMGDRTLPEWPDRPETLRCFRRTREKYSGRAEETYVLYDAKANRCYFFRRSVDVPTKY